MAAGKESGAGLSYEARLSQAWTLTPAEARVVSLLSTGLTATQIASVEGLSVHTIRTQLKRALVKAGVHSQVALVARALAIKP